MAAKAKKPKPAITLTDPASDGSRASYPSEREDARRARDKRSRKVRLDAALDDRLSVILANVPGRTLADVLRAGIETLEALEGG